MYFDELHIGLEVEPESVKIDREEMLAFAKRFDDVPIHTDENFAKTTKFGDIISPGIYTFLCVWSEYLRKDFFGDELIAGKSQKIEWLAPVFADDALSARAFISSLTPRNEKNGIAELTLEIFNQNGAMVISALTEAIIKKKKLC